MFCKTNTYCTPTYTQQHFIFLTYTRTKLFDHHPSFALHICSITAHIFDMHLRFIVVSDSLTSLYTNRYHCPIYCQLMFMSVCLCVCWMCVDMFAFVYLCYVLLLNEAMHFSPFSRRENTFPLSQCASSSADYFTCDAQISRMNRHRHWTYSQVLYTITATRSR